MASAPVLGMDKKAEDLKERTKSFAHRVLEFVETLPHTAAAQELARQLSRSGLGVAGNYRSSCRARSHTEFTARLAIVLEEADEAQLWIDVAEKQRFGDESQRAWLLQESGELRAIFSKACSTARSHERTTAMTKRRSSRDRRA